MADDSVALPLDHAFLLSEGTDLTLVSWGAMLKETMAAAENLASEGISAEVIDLATLKGTGHLVPAGEKAHVQG